MKASVPDDVDGEKRIREHREWLEPTDYKSPGNEYMKHVAAHVPGTGAWIWESPTFREWATSSSTRPLHLRGVAGSGKSVLAASTIRHFISSEPDTPVLFFFFRQIVEKNHSANYLIRDFLAQLLPYSPRLLSEFNERADNGGISHHDSNLWHLLKLGLEDVPKLYCVVDALDEMDEDGFDIIDGLLGAATASKGAIRLIITSRPIPKIEEALAQHDVLQERLEASRLYPDVSKLVKANMEKLQPKLSSTMEERVERAICEKAKGLFLHARLMLDSLTQGLKEGRITEKDLPESLESLPDTLKDVYESILTQHAAKSGVTMEQQKSVLSCVIYASRPLRLIELGSLLARMRGDDDLKEGKRLARASCGRLLDILKDETVSVIHHSFTEFLRDETRAQPNSPFSSSPGKTPNFPVLSPSHGHAMLVTLSLQYLDACSYPRSGEQHVQKKEKREENEGGKEGEASIQKEDESWFDSSLDSSESLHDRLDRWERKKRRLQDMQLRHPLLSYAAENLRYHLRSIAPDDHVRVVDLLETYMIHGRPAHKAWQLCSFHSTSPLLRRLHPPRGNFNVLHLVAYYSLAEIIGLLASRHEPEFINARDSSGYTALIYAVQQDDGETVSALLRAGADPRLDDSQGRTPLHHAATRGSLTAARILLRSGVTPLIGKTKEDVNEKSFWGTSDLGDTALLYALQACTSVPSETKDHDKGHGDNYEDRIHEDEDEYDEAVIDRRDRRHWHLFLECLPYMPPETATEYLHKVKCAETLEAILKTGHADVNALYNGATILFKMAAERQLESMRVLLRYGADPNKRCHVDLSSWDAWRGMGEVDETDDGPMAIHALGSGASDLIISNESHRVVAQECLQLLLDHGAQIDAKATERGLTALHMSVDKTTALKRSWTWDEDERQGAMTVALLRAGADANATASCKACLSRQPSKTRGGAMSTNRGNREQQQQQQRKIKRSGGTCKGLTPLFFVDPGNPDLVDLLVEYGAEVNARDCGGRTPLLTVMSETSLWDKSTIGPLCQKLMDNGASVDILDNKDNDMIHDVFRRLSDLKAEDIPFLAKLLDKGPDLNKADHEGVLPLFRWLPWVFRSGPIMDEEVVRFLVEVGGLDLNVRDGEGHTILFKLPFEGWSTESWDTMGSLDTECLDSLIKLGADPKVRDYSGQTLLIHLAKDRGCISREWIDYFVSLGVDPLIRDAEGDSLAHLVMKNQDPNMELLQSLAALGSSLSQPTAQGQLPIHMAAAHKFDRDTNSPQWLETVMENPELFGQVRVNARGNHGQTPLHIASSVCEYQVRRLIQAGADPTLVTNGNESPLHKACQKIENYSVTSLLLSEYKKRDLLEKMINLSETKTQRTALHIACQSGCVESIDMLLKNGASPTARDASGFTALGAVFRESDDDFMARAADEKATSDMLLVRMALEMNHERVVSAILASSFHDSHTADNLYQGLGNIVDEFARREDDLFTRPNTWKDTALHRMAQGGRANLLRHFHKEASEVDSKIEEELRLQRETEVGNKDTGGKRHGHAPQYDESYHDSGGPGTLLSVASASQHPNLEVIRVLVEEIGVDVNACAHLYGFRDKIKKSTALHTLACGEYLWQIEAMEYLLSQGADMSAVNLKGQTPLMVAISSEPPNGFWAKETAEVLLRHGADARSVDPVSRLPLLALATDIDMVQLLLSYGALAGDVLTRAVENMNVDVVSALCEAGANPDDLIFPDYHQGQENADLICVLHYAATYPVIGDGDNIYDVSIPETQRHRVVELLLDYGADFFAKYPDGSNCLQGVIENHGAYNSIAEHAARFGLLDIENRGSGGRTLLISACMPTTRRPVRYFIYEGRIPPATPYTQVAIDLLRNGAQRQAVDDQGRTALHWLCTMAGPPSDCDRRLVEMLAMEVDGDDDKTGNSPVNTQDHKGFRPINLAFQAHAFWAADILMKHGASPLLADPDGNTALHFLAPRLVGETNAASQKAELFRQYLGYGLDINHRNNRGETPVYSLFTADWNEFGQGEDLDAKRVITTHNHILSNLLVDSSGAAADLFTVTDDGSTLLHATAKRPVPERGDCNSRATISQYEEQGETFKRLLELGLDPRKEDNEMRTPVDIAVALGRDQIVELFAPEKA